jgi:NTP pyrophosphatase (non-canonical NTP hydrolase)
MKMMRISMMNKPLIYDAALARWGYDSQVLVVAEECNELAAACTRFVNHKANGMRVAEEAADVEIMIEQLRHNGMDSMIEEQKIRKLRRLARRVGEESEPGSPFAPSVCELLSDAGDSLNMTGALYRDTHVNKRQAAAHARMAIGLLMQAAQKMIGEQQRQERNT